MPYKKGALMGGNKEKISGSQQLIVKLDTDNITEV
jgi:hypothetical protein